MKLDQLEVKHRFAQVNGIRYHFVERGTGPLVLLLNGFPETWWGWRYQLEPLAKAGFRVVAADQRGYGETEKSGPYDFGTLSSDVEALIHTLGAKRAHVVGQGMGGAVAWHVGAFRPTCVDRLVVLNCPHPTMAAQALHARPTQFSASWHMMFFQVPMLPERLLNSDRAVLFTRHYQARSKDLAHFTPEELRPILDAMQQPGAATAMLGWYRAAFKKLLVNRMRLPTYPQIEAPTMIVWGKSDVGLTYEEVVPGTEAHVPFLRVVPVENCGHYVQAEQPAAVNEALIGFLRASEDRVRKRPSTHHLEFSERDVVLVSAGENKISVIKEVRELIGIELKDAKALVERVPAVLVAGALTHDAERIRDRLTAVGALVQLAAAGNFTAPATAQQK